MKLYNELYEFVYLKLINIYLSQITTARMTKEKNSPKLFDLMMATK